ncbi:hypothetical protein ACFYZ8_00295 [Streptomyces sp. NPDC001668]
MGTFGARNSLGTVYSANGAEKAASNGFYIMLKRAPGHPRGYYVYTCYPR